MKVGLLGGAFNPPHIGHLVAAQEAAWQLGLDKVALLPTGQAPHKPIESDPGAEVRLEMARLATAGDDRLDVNPIEVESEEVSYTYRTLERIAEQRPGDELVLILGADQAASLDEWREPGRVLELARLAVADRAGTDRDAVSASVEDVGGEVAFFSMPRIDVSSTMVRARVAAGQPIRHLVPDPVASFVEREGLYR